MNMKALARCATYSGLLSLLLQAAWAGTRVSIPFVFEKNAGQVDPQVRFFGRTPGAGLWLVDTGAVLSVELKNRRAVLRMKLEGARPHPAIDGAQPLSGKSNYFAGNDPAKWRKDIPQYAAVRYQHAYPGVDLVFHASSRTMEYDWIVSAGADPRQIQMSFEGATDIHIDGAGDLVLRIGDVEVREKRPEIYQEGLQGREKIDGRFVRHGRKFGFEVAKYDRSRALTIDPILTYATHLGGSGNAPNQEGDIAYGVAEDAQGNVIVVGTTASTNFPTQSGLYSDFSENPLNAFVTKMNTAAFAGASLIWSTYLGGTTNDTQAAADAVDSQGNVYLTGVTFASDFPLVNPFQTSFSGAETCKGPEDQPMYCGHVFVTKISSGGDKVVYSTYLGGTSLDSANSIAVDGAGDAWLCGDTQSSDFPVRGNYIQTGLHGLQAGFVSKLSPDGSQLLYSTYLGGEKTDNLLAITLDSAGIAYVAGWSSSVSFPVVNAYQAAQPSGIRAGVVAKINPNVSPSLLYSTFLGGSVNGGLLDAIAVDGTGNIFVGGRSASTTFPLTANAVQTASALGPQGDTGTGAVVAELNPAEQGAAQLEYSTFLTGGFLDEVNAIALDKAGHIIVAGYTGSPFFPTTSDAFQQLYSGVISDGVFSTQAFLTIIDPTVAGLNGLVYSTLYGGLYSETANALVLDATGTIATITGGTTSSDLFVTPNAYQRGLSSQYGDVLVATFNLAQSGPVLSSMVNAASFANATNQFAPGEIVTFFGSSLGPQALVTAELDSTGHLANTLGGCQLLVDNFPAPLVYVQAGQVAAILPYELTPIIGKSTENYAQMVCNNVPGNVLEFKVAAADPAIFSATQTGKGQAAVLNQDGSYNSASNPAAAGSIVQIFATGEGVLNPPGQDGHIENGPIGSIPTPALPVTVTFGGAASPKITYAGVAPGQVDGLLQIDAQLPTGLTPGNVPIVLNIGTYASPQGLTIAVQ
jgi:uncharacterized protein (TIGR03437 family)